MGFLDSIFGGSGGKTKAKSTLDMVNSQLVTVTQSVVNTCAVTTNQEVIVNLAGNVGVMDLSGSTITQTTTVNVNCVLSSQNKSDISNKLSNAIAQLASAKGTFSPFGKTTANAITNIQNTVSTAINSLSSNNISASIQQKIGINASNNQGVLILKNLTLDQSAQAVAQSIVDAVNNTGITQALANSIDQRTKAETVSPLGSIFGDISSYVWMFILFIIFIVLAAIIYVFVGRGSGSSAGGFKDTDVVTGVF